jgi:hypothetical protein
MDEARTQRWEYLVLRLPHDRQRADEIGGERAYRVDQDEAILNALGVEGWEVVAAAWPAEQAVLQVVLKRPR